MSMKSTIWHADRAKALVTEIGEPSSETTRSPRAAIPGVRPAQNSSNSIG